VSAYLERWLDEGERAKLDLNRVGDHAAQCARCYTRLSHFFRTVQLPESSYLRETIDELALSVLNLARAVIRDRPPDVSEEEAAVLAITEEGGGSADENVNSGNEMIDDAEDYAGSSLVGGTDLESIRRLLGDATQAAGLRVDLALELFSRVTELDSRYAAQAWNWIGALRYRQERLDESEAACLKVLSLQEGLREVRSFAHCTLAYIFKQRGDLKQAIKAARRSVVLAEEDGKDPYFGRFAEVYFRLLRDDPEDLAAARDALASIGKDKAGEQRFRDDLLARANAPVLEAFRRSPLSASFSL
jgi:tetratricopeptide (TPR) repeat protein